MKNLLLSGLFLLVSVNLAAKEINWDGVTEVSDDDGIKVFERATDSEIVEVIGETILDHPIDRVLSVVSKSSRANEWMPRVEKIVKIQQIDEWSRVQYSHLSSPWPVNGRVFITKGGIEIAQDAQSAIVNFSSVDGYEADREGRVEGRLLKSFFYLEKDENNPEKTFMRVNVVADPGGWLPSFLVNFFQKRWPVGFFKGIRNQLEKEDIIVDSRFKKIFSNPQPSVAH